MLNDKEHRPTEWGSNKGDTHLTNETQLKRTAGVTVGSGTLRGVVFIDAHSFEVNRIFVLSENTSIWVYFKLWVHCCVDAKLFYISCLLLFCFLIFCRFLIFYSYYYLSILYSSLAQPRSAWFLACLLVRPLPGCLAAPMSLRTYTGRGLKMGFSAGVQGHTFLSTLVMEAFSKVYLDAFH